jgi:hypothetical protein
MLSIFSKASKVFLCLLIILQASLGHIVVAQSFPNDLVLTKSNVSSNPIAA